jgi:hypothetical protein
MTVVRTSLVAISGCIALVRGAVCSPHEGDACEYQVTSLELDATTSSGMAIGDELAALEGPFPGTWRWYSSREEVTIDGGGVELPAQATFVPDIDTLRESVFIGGGLGAYCGDRGIRVDGTLTFTDEQGATIVEIPILVERREDGPAWRYVAGPQFPEISEFSNRLHENVEYDRSGIWGRVRWQDGGLTAEFTYFGESTLSAQSGAGVFFDIADFE